MLLGLHGAQGAGKDYVADLLVRDHGFVKLHFADALKASLEHIDPIVETPTGNAYAPPGHARLTAVLAYYGGWDQAKREVPEVRRLLRAHGEGLKRTPLGESVWTQAAAPVVSQLERGDGRRRVVFADLRFDAEALYVLGHHSPHTGSRMHNQIWHVVRPDNPHADPTDPTAGLSIRPEFITSRVENDDTLAEQIADLADYLEEQP